MCATNEVKAVGQRTVVNHAAAKLNVAVVHRNAQAGVIHGFAEFKSQGHDLWDPGRRRGPGPLVSYVGGDACGGVPRLWLSCVIIHRGRRTHLSPLGIVEWYFVQGVAASPGCAAFGPIGECIPGK